MIFNNNNLFPIFTHSVTHLFYYIYLNNFLGLVWILCRDTENQSVIVRAITQWDCCHSPLSMGILLRWVLFPLGYFFVSSWIPLVDSRHLLNKSYLETLTCLCTMLINVTLGKWFAVLSNHSLTENLYDLH